LNAWTNLYETRHVYHATWARLNGVLHKSLPSVCVSVFVSPITLLGNNTVKTSPFFAKQRLGKNVTASTNTRNSNRIVRRVVFSEFRVVSKESRRLVLPRTSCFKALICERFFFSHFYFEMEVSASSRLQ
jgi:hypothetical protein